MQNNGAVSGSESERGVRRPTPDMLVDVDRLVSAYYSERPDPSDPAQAVSFGTSGHRGSSLTGTFTESHIVAITDAIVRYRSAQGITGPLFLGRDTHALSAPAFRTAVEVLVAHGVDVMIDAEDGFTPTPAISHAILTHNADGRATPDGIVITPSHNPPEDGGFQVQPAARRSGRHRHHQAIQEAANELLRRGLDHVGRVAYDAAVKRARRHDYVSAYVGDLEAVVNVRGHRGLRCAARGRPPGGASVAYWQAIADRYRLDLEVVNDQVDPTFSFMPLTTTARSAWIAPALTRWPGSITLKDRFDVAWGNDPDADRHGIVTRSAGLMNPNHYLAVAIRLFAGIEARLAGRSVVGKTMVSSGIIDRVVNDLRRTLWEVPVGFKWFSPDCSTARCYFGGEESAGASFLRTNGRVWTTDKDGLIMGLLAAEITARTGKDPGEHYRRDYLRFGEPFYRRIDAPATPEQKTPLKNSRRRPFGNRRWPASRSQNADGRTWQQCAHGRPQGHHQTGWFAARPSGTEDIYKLYAESFRERSAPRPDPRGGPGGCRRCSRRLIAPRTRTGF